MKKILATILTLAILLSVAPSLGTVADAASTPDKPFIAMAWSPVDMEKFGNIEDAPIIQVNNIGGTINLNNSDPADLAKSIKAKLDKLPEGMRHIRLNNTSVAFELGAKLVIYVGEGITQLRTQFQAFVEAYYALGGKLDGVILDTEYVDMGNWYLYTSGYGGVYEKDIKNHNFYNELVAHPRYATEIRPMLEEYGFVFYENVGGDKSEIWSIYPYQYLNNSKYPTYAADYAKYASCASIWNRVMYDRQAIYLSYALYEPMAARYPDAVMSDYQAYDSGTWYKNLISYSNGMKVGNVSNYNDYLRTPGEDYFKSGSTYLYQNPASYYEASYDQDPYGMLVWNVNRFKNMYEATDTKKISVWIAEYDYGSMEGAYRNSPYYTESLYHYGMLDPQPFLIYMYSGDSKFKGDAGKVEYDKRLEVISQVLDELTRVAGYSDRKPISVPANWNDGYMLTGMYAGGRNIWRITPDTTDGTTLEAFKIKDSDPTFRINGTTITFPGGKIIKDSAVSVVGSVGYWVETSKNVTPVVTRDADRYAENPAYMEDYESYKTGAALTAANVALPQTWEITASKDLVITEQGGGKALALTGTATLKNVKLPKNVTAGDSYAKQQAWEISVTLPKAMNSDAKVILLNTTLDGGIKLEGGKVYYDESGSYEELTGVSLTAGQKYTFKRDINFTRYTCTYSVYAGDKLVKEVADVKMKTVALPVEEIYISCSGLTTQALIDDYKLYPTGLAQNLTVYDANGGEQLPSTEKNAQYQVAYRLSWLNATQQSKNVRVKAAFYDSSNKLISESVLTTVEMAPGNDGVITGVVDNLGDKVTVYLEDAKEIPETKPTEATKKPTEATKKPTEASKSPTEATKKPATTATKSTEPTVKPTKSPTKMPTNSATKTPTKATVGKNTKPTATLKPGETLAPQETLAPTETLAPEETLAPSETLAPEETLAPGETLAPDATEAPNASEATDTTDATTPETPNKNESKGGANVGVIVAIVVVALAAAGGACWYFLIFKKKKAN